MDASKAIILFAICAFAILGVYLTFHFMRGNWDGPFSLIAYVPGETEPLLPTGV